jgi:hypothetical protein
MVTSDYGYFFRYPFENALCAIAAKATFLVSEDKHLRVLKNYPYFGVELIRLNSFRQWFVENHI